MLCKELVLSKTVIASWSCPRQSLQVGLVQSMFSAETRALFVRGWDFFIDILMWFYVAILRFCMKFTFNSLI